MEYLNNVFVITGGGNGMGRELVLQMLRRGSKIVALDISEEGLGETAQLAGDFAKNLLTHKIDITNKTEVEALPKLVKDHFGKIDGVINMAGIIQPFVKVQNLTYAQIERVLNVNLYGTIYMVKTFLPELLKNETTAYLVNVSSMGGFLPVPGQSIYGASKAAVKLFTEGLYAECKGSNVQVNLVLPGAIGTNIVVNSKVASPSDQAKSEENSKHKVLSVQKACEIILNGLERNKLKILVGNDAKFMDRFYRLAPQKAINLITSKMKDLLK